MRATIIQRRLGISLPTSSPSSLPLQTKYAYLSSTSRRRPDETSQNVMSVAQSYINNIRLKIATTLTSSMEEEDRQQLLTSLNITDHNRTSNSSDSSHTVKEELTNNQVKQKEGTLSIGEAVAAAVAKEASKNKALLEQERMAIFEQAEKAARDRVQNDLLLQERTLALKRWERELEEEKIAEEETMTAGENKEEDVHPILGKVMMDFGYKRIHVMSTKKLAAIPIWEKQRVYRHDRAKVMARDKLKSMELGLPGVVALHENTDGELSIIDGQHRVGMLAILQTRKSKENNTSTNDDSQALNLDKILVEVFPQTPSSSPSHAQDIFVEINKAEPVKLVDMPGVAKSADRKIINDAATHLEETFPEMFKPSQRCRSPHLNVDNLRDAIFASGLLKKHKIRSKTALVKWILQRNEELALKYDKEDGEGDSKKPAIQKARMFDFYLGLDSSWLNQ